MNATPDNHEPNSVDELSDRLMDRALAEVAGGEAPPDLSEHILAGHRPSLQAGAEIAGGRRSGRSFWLTLAVAAMLFIAAVPLLLPAVQSARESSRRLQTVATRTPDGGESAPALLVETTPVPTAEKPGSRMGRGGQRDFRPNREGGGTATADFNTMIDMIQSTTDNDTWYYKEGGEGKGTKFDTNLSLEISQSQTVQGASAPESMKLNKALTPLFGGPAVDAPPVVYPPAEIWSGLTKRRKDLYSSEDAKLKQSDEVGLLVNDSGSMLHKVLDVNGEGQLASGLRPNKESELGTGAGLPGDQYVRIYENPFIKAEGRAAVSTFSIDVDTASYANVRRFLMQENTLPPPDAVRLEELVNYFKYDYAGPAKPQAEQTTARGDKKEMAPFAAHLEVAGCPWKPAHRLVRIGIKGLEMDRRERPKSNLVFLVDVSGSMDEPIKLPLVIDGLKELARELGENDRVAIVVYAQQEGLVLPSTVGSNQALILGSLNQLRAGGSTAGGAGIQLAYQVAEDNFIRGGTNRVILCTDGDFNVGVTSTAELQRMVEQKAKDTGVFLSVLGFGRGNLNDQMMEAVADHGNGNYHYVDSLREARRVFVEEMTGTLVTIAKDVKIQVEFNPRQVAGYRLLGYENRMLRTEDFNDDKKDAGEIGAGHTVTALYEVVPAGKPVDLPPVDALKYQQPAADRSRLSDDEKAAATSRELLTLKMKYKRPEADKSEEAIEWAVTDDGQAFNAASGDFQFASAVAGFGMLLRDSQYKGNLTYAAAIELAQGGVGSDEQGYRRELVEMARRAKQLRGE